MYLLSICIPTRNRPQALLKTVNEVQKQIIANNFLDKAEIVISDNTDKEDLKINPSLFKDKNIHYFSNAGNIGYARNINKVILNARGKYVWLLADDDIILESAVENILNCLESQREEINYLTFYSGAVLKNFKDNNFYFKNCSRHYFADGKDFLKKYWISVIFVSVNIFNREKMIYHAKKNNLFENINDVYQNSLLCISFIDKFGGVKIIPKTLLFDSYNPKLYTPENSVRVPVLEYVKLLVQLKKIGVDKKCLSGIKKEVERSIISNGLKFVIRKAETPDDFDYSAEYLKVIKNKELYFFSRIKAGFIYLLLKFNKILSKLIVKSIYILTGRKNHYKNILQENLNWYEDIKKNKIKISYE